MKDFAERRKRQNKRRLKKIDKKQIRKTFCEFVAESGIYKICICRKRTSEREEANPSVAADDCRKCQGKPRKKRDYGRGVKPRLFKFYDNKSQRVKQNNEQKFAERSESAHKNADKQITEHETQPCKNAFGGGVTAFRRRLIHSRRRSITGNRLRGLRDARKIFGRRRLRGLRLCRRRGIHVCKRRILRVFRDL